MMFKDLMRWEEIQLKKSLILVFFVCLLFKGVISKTLAQEQSGLANEVRRDGSSLFSSDTMIFLQFNDLGGVAQRMLEHPLRQKIERVEPVRQGMASPQFLLFKLGLGFVEAQIGSEWLPALKSIAGDGIFVGVDRNAQSTGIAVHAADEELLKKIVGQVLSFIKNQAGSGSEPFVVADYAGGKTAKFENNGAIGRFGKWLLLSNDYDYLLQMADRLSPDHHGETLSDSKRFQNARAATTGKSDAWLFTDLEPIRASGQAAELFRGMTDEPGVELLFGGILEAFKTAEWFAADLSFENDRLAFHARLPFDAHQIPDTREFFFGTQGQGRAPAKLDIPDVILQTTSFRNLGAWWLSKEDLFSENVVAQLAQGDSQLSTVFGGIDFGSEVLGTLQPGMRLIIKGQNYPENVNPETKLPAFALVARLQNPEQARRFRISFQSLVGLLNLAEGGMDRPQIDVISTREDGVQLTAGTYAPEGGYDGSLTIFNFSPTLAFQDDYMIISSTEQLARELAFKTKELGDEADTSDSNTTVSLNIPETIQIFRENLGALVANQMLEKGISRQEAEAEIELALELLNFTKGASLDFRVEEKLMTLKIEVTLNQ